MEEGGEVRRGTLRRGRGEEGDMEEGGEVRRGTWRRGER